jgi:four helix bundle protein
MRKDKLESNLIVKQTFEFALLVIDYCKKLDRQKEFQLSKQLFRSGTSIGANVCEAQNAESKADFIHKFKIAAKEVDETQYWLLLCKHSSGYPNCELLLQKLEEIDKIITKIISSTKTKLG